MDSFCEIRSPFLSLLPWKLILLFNDFYLKYFIFKLNLLLELIQEIYILPIHSFFQLDKDNVSWKFNFTTQSNAGRVFNVSFTTLKRYQLNTRIKHQLIFILQEHRRDILFPFNKFCFTSSFRESQVICTPALITGQCCHVLLQEHKPFLHTRADFTDAPTDLDPTNSAFCKGFPVDRHVWRCFFRCYQTRTVIITQTQIPSHVTLLQHRAVIN